METAASRANNKLLIILNNFVAFLAILHGDVFVMYWKVNFIQCLKIRTLSAKLLQILLIVSKVTQGEKHMTFYGMSFNYICPGANKVNYVYFRFVDRHVYCQSADCAYMISTLIAWPGSNSVLDRL